MADPRKTARELAIFKGKNRVVPNIPMYLQDSVNFSFTSDYGNLLDMPSNGVVDTAADAFSTIGKFVTGNADFGVSAHNKYFGFQQWKGTQPVTFQMTISFHMGMTDSYSGLLEVYDPIMTLCELALPSEGVGGILSPPNGQLMSLLLSTASKNLSDVGFTAMKTADERAGSGAFISLRIGEMAFLPRVILKRAEPSFATEFDSQGYPISGTVTLEFSSAFAATKELLKVWRAKGSAGLRASDGKGTSDYYDDPPTVLAPRAPSTRNLS